jgi:hypothetical protein
MMSRNQTEAQAIPRRWMIKADKICIRLTNCMVDHIAGFGG